jgi:hypothetical protein
MAKLDSHRHREGARKDPGDAASVKPAVRGQDRARWPVNMDRLIARGPTGFAINLQRLIVYSTSLPAASAHWARKKAGMK